MMTVVTGVAEYPENILDTLEKSYNVAAIEKTVPPKTVEINQKVFKEGFVK